MNEPADPRAPLQLCNLEQPSASAFMGYHSNSDASLSRSSPGSHGVHVMMPKLDPGVGGRTRLAILEVNLQPSLLSCPAQVTGEFYHLDKYPHLNADCCPLRYQRSPEVLSSTPLFQVIPAHFSCAF